MPPADVRPAKCLGGCGRWLRDPVSVERGYGRVCAERHGIPVNASPRPTPATAARTPTTATVPPMSGQLPLEFPPVGGPVLYSDWIPGDRLHDRPVRTVPTSDLL